MASLSYFARLTGINKDIIFEMIIYYIYTVVCILNCIRKYIPVAITSIKC